MKFKLKMQIKYLKSQKPLYISVLEVPPSQWDPESLELFILEELNYR